MDSLITMADMRTNYSREIVELLRKAYGGSVRIFDSIIPLSIRAAETSAESWSIYLHDPAGKVSAAYAALTWGGHGIMKGSASKIQVSGFDDLFQTGGCAGPDTKQMQEIPLTELFPFKGHPFQVRDDDAMRKMVESIAECGVLSPVSVQAQFPRRGKTIFHLAFAEVPTFDHSGVPQKVPPLQTSPLKLGSLCVHFRRGKQGKKSLFPRVLSIFGALRLCPKEKTLEEASLLLLRFFYVASVLTSVEIAFAFWAI